MRHLVQTGMFGTCIEMSHLQNSSVCGACFQWRSHGRIGGLLPSF